MITCTTLCYLEKNDSYLMLHRIKKKSDVNKDKWIGVGGHCEDGESPEDCVRRETFEETGITLKSERFRGIVTFVCGSDITDYMMLFTSDYFIPYDPQYPDKLKDCDEGVLEWVSKSDISKLNLWPGDKIFFKLLDEDAVFFSLKLVYDKEDRFISAALNGRDLNLDKIFDSEGNITDRPLEGAYK
ncbi:MAG: 8-oxo-dGTP diphosphatase [Lachnospiraceae bacterium]|nr:8-oxo-dGTP diphosphatase [Lachnospiraceae bacterium]